ncbi:type II toxin-antitoxin system CcdA family antitoxin [Oricola sp.]|uniref:type II toxin-antitoxin system CcdA family antitoxin n=1 Tax=Oricola sp. TaxID=1979950 RepID=UPI0025E71306|nr:type II toxin-antitoxin system CcdA family antitoxin [Oricola sp.]MCI5073687.1 type II toxin-antitoxin system CcdA family antitoxin [Oricola sp.]
MNESKPIKRSSANLSVSSDLIAEAKALDINLSRAAEDGISKAVREEKTRRWKEDNAEAIADWNRWVAEHGLPLAKYRMF